jgi:hypothetical protein
VDTRGAVDLSLRATDIALPDAEVLRSEAMRQLAEDAGLGLPPAMWTRLQFTRLAAAAVLEARLLHVRASRLGAFNLVADPEKVTLRQLAPLHLTHNGTAGQAFELAVAGAVIAQDPEVTGLVRAGLRRLNLSGDGRLSMVVLGMEKVPLGERDDFWGEVLRVLPRDGKFRTGRPGRPSNAATAIERLAASTSESLRLPKDVTRDVDVGRLTQMYVRDQRSQLGRADALVTCGSDLVAVSLKINRRHAVQESWRDVPLWITVGPEAGVESDRSSSSPRVTVTLPADGWYAVFRDALAAVDAGLGHVNRDRAYMMRPVNGQWSEPWLEAQAVFRVSDAVARTLWQRRDQTVAEVAAHLRQTHPAVVEAADGLRFGEDVVEMTSLDVPRLLDGWREESDAGRLFTQGHLFRHLTPQEHAKVVVAT